jgi:hypothetical protein
MWGRLVGSVAGSSDGPVNPSHRVTNNIRIKKFKKISCFNLFVDSQVAKSFGVKPLAGKGC